MDKNRKLRFLTTTELPEAIYAIIQDSPRIVSAIKALREEGFEAQLLIEITIELCEIESQLPLPLSAPRTFVGEDDNVLSGVFTNKDRKFFRKLGISLDIPHS